MQNVNDAVAGAPGKRGAKVAFLGNSILYFNDCPRLVVNLGRLVVRRGDASNERNTNTLYEPYVERQDSCLRGGTNLTELWKLGNGMKQHGFLTDAAKIGTSETDGSNVYDVGAPTVHALLENGGGKWDFVILNDHTQGPARRASQQTTQVVLLERYLPLFLASGATPVIIETAAYRVPGIHNSNDLGSTNEFQQRVREGIEMYLDALRPHLPPSMQPRLAPVGTAFLYVRDNNHALWERLFDPYDHFHPSAAGTFLQGCVLHRTLFGRSPPLPRTEEDIACLWKDTRIVHRIEHEKRQRLPSVTDVEYLWGVANKFCTSDE